MITAQRRWLGGHRVTTYYVCFSANYDPFLSLEDMLRIEADNPQAAVEQVLSDGRGPIDRRLNCVTVVSLVQGRKDRGTFFWLNFDGEPKHLRDIIFGA